MAEKKTIILDTDPGMGLPYADIDDNLALLFALGSPELETALISIVEGNVPAHYGVQSINETLDYLADTVPVALGSQRPLFRPYVAGQEIGKQRLGPIDFGGTMSVRDQIEDPADGLFRMSRLLEEATSPVTILAVGPLTNVALLLHQRPDLHSKIDSIVIMGGAVEREGNITPFAEFNIWVDPDAAAMVFSSPVKKVLVPLDITTTIELTLDDFRPSLEGLGNQRFTTYTLDSIQGWIEVQTRASGATGFHPHDPIAAAYLVDPTLFGSETMEVTVDTRTGETIGRRDPKGSTEVCLTLDGGGFKKLFFERLGRVRLK
jgi:inosine-uridine nucleoside N-ribohydrolase